MSSAYQVLHITPTSVRGCAAFGIMEVEVALDDIKDFYIDADTFLSILKNLPNAELELSLKDKVLHWLCGPARGQYACKDQVTMPELKWEKTPSTELPSDFSKNLELGSLACGTTALLSVGLYGTVLENNSELCAYASDDTTISCCQLSEGIEDSVEKATFSPDACRLLGVITNRNKAALAIDATTLYCQTSDTKLILKQIPPLKQDINNALENFQKSDISISLNREVIKAFIARAEALTEEKGRAVVTISVEDRATQLRFVENTSITEQFYLVEDAPDIKVPPIAIEARRLSKALAHSKEIIFDYAEKRVLILRGDNEFQFVIMGKRQQ